MNVWITQIVMAAFGALGFAMLFNLRRDKWLTITIASGVTWFVYLLAEKYSGSLFAASFAGAGFATFYSEVMARLRKGPVTLFLFPCLIPLVPGGTLYYTMYAAATSNRKDFNLYGSSTAETTLGICVGVIAVSVFFYYLSKLKSSGQ